MSGADRQGQANVYLFYFFILDSVIKQSFQGIKFNKWIAFAFLFNGDTVSLLMYNNIVLFQTGELHQG